MGSVRLFDRFVGSFAGWLSPVPPSSLIFLRRRRAFARTDAFTHTSTSELLLPIDRFAVDRTCRHRLRIARSHLDLTWTRRPSIARMGCFDFVLCCFKVRCLHCKQRDQVRGRAMYQCAFPSCLSKTASCPLTQARIGVLNHVLTCKNATCTNRAMRQAVRSQKRPSFPTRPRAPS